MDPISQGVVGAAAAQLAPAHMKPQRAWLYGALGGMAADLDVLIRSTSDPLLQLEYHRHFTHGLAFAPLGGAIVALPFLWARTAGKIHRRPDALMVLLSCIIGYVTHGLLDLCTSYGTVVLWPFTDKRFALDWISIVDPIFTLPLCAGVLLTQRRAQKRFLLVALCLSFGYLCLGAFQHGRAVDAQQQLMAHRSLESIHGRVMPSLASIRTWRSVSKYVDKNGETRLIADLVQTPLFGETRVIEGSTIRALEVQAEPILVEREQIRRDIERFQFFSDGLLARLPTEPTLIGDMRYSIEPAAFQPLWGLRIDESSEGPKLSFIRRDAQQDPNKLLKRIWNQPLGVPLSEIISSDPLVTP